MSNVLLYSPKINGCLLNGWIIMMTFTNLPRDFYAIVTCIITRPTNDLSTWLDHTGSIQWKCRDTRRNTGRTHYSFLSVSQHSVEIPQKFHRFFQYPVNRQSCLLGYCYKYTTYRKVVLDTISLLSDMQRETLHKYSTCWTHLICIHYGSPLVPAKAAATLPGVQFIPF